MLISPKTGTQCNPDKKITGTCIQVLALTCKHQVLALTWNHIATAHQILLFKVIEIAMKCWVYCTEWQTCKMAEHQKLCFQVEQTCKRSRTIMIFNLHPNNLSKVQVLHYWYQNYYTLCSLSTLTYLYASLSSTVSHSWFSEVLSCVNVTWKKIK